MYEPCNCSVVFAKPNGSIDTTTLPYTPHSLETTMNRHLTDMIIKYEMGDLDDLDCIALFQELIDTGLAWQLQGHYGRTATALIEAGYCEAKS